MRDKVFKFIYLFIFFFREDKVLNFIHKNTITTTVTISYSWFFTCTRATLQNTNAELLAREKS
jgi:quinol-cytochrome oxidoreductase complex cytochrome b subunit